MTQHITHEKSVELAMLATVMTKYEMFALQPMGEARASVHELCNAAIQTYIEQQAQALPELPEHPEPRTMKWSDLEIAAMQTFGLQCAANAREKALEESAIYVDHILKEGGGTYGDAIRKLKAGK